MTVHMTMYITYGTPLYYKTKAYVWRSVPFDCACDCISHMAHHCTIKQKHMCGGMCCLEQLLVLALGTYVRVAVHQVPAWCVVLTAFPNWPGHTFQFGNKHMHCPYTTGVHLSSFGDAVSTLAFCQLQKHATKSI